MIGSVLKISFSAYIEWCTHSPCLDFYALFQTHGSNGNILLDLGTFDYGSQLRHWHQSSNGNPRESWSLLLEDQYRPSHYFISSKKKKNTFLNHPLVFKPSLFLFISIIIAARHEPLNINVGQGWLAWGCASCNSTCSLLGWSWGKVQVACPSHEKIEKI